MIRPAAVAGCRLKTEATGLEQVRTGPEQNRTPEAVAAEFESDTRPAYRYRVAIAGGTRTARSTR